MTFLKASCQKSAGTKQYKVGVGWLVPVQCAFETTEPALFEAHMKTTHGARVQWKPALPLKPFKASRAKELWQPKPGDVGSEVTFEHEGRTLTGQVWSLAWGGVWVITEDQAVYGVKLSKNRRPRVFQKYPSPAERAAERDKRTS